MDIPCSGVKSLWTGALFLLAATLIENRPLNARWLLAAVVTGILLVVSNLLRVAILALTGPALGWELLARMLHIPLGVLGFLGTCAAALALLGQLPGRVEKSSGEEDIGARGGSLRPGWLGPLLGLFVLSMIVIYSPRPADSKVLAGGAPAWDFPEGFLAQSVPLAPNELERIRQGGADTADRYVFQWQDSNRLAYGAQPISGTVMLLTSQTWRGQHRPERCFEIFGLTVQKSITHLAADNFSLRYLTLSGSGGSGQVSAAYWLQSASRTTDDFGQRIWADLAAQRERWVLVTILFDREYDNQLPGNKSGRSAV